MNPLNKPNSRILAILILLVVGSTAFPGLTGCGRGSDVWRDTLYAIADSSPGLDAEAKREVARFEKALRSKAERKNIARSMRHFKDAFRRVRWSYVEPVDEGALIDVAIEGLERVEEDVSQVVAPDEYVDRALHRMVASLDPHSGYLDAEEYRDIDIATKGEFGGIGVRAGMDADSGAIRVISPIEDTPADRAGIKAGDLIVKIDGLPIKGMDLAKAVRLMRGAPGADILLTVERDGLRPFDVSITRAVIRIKSVRWRFEEGVGYLRVSSFNRKVSDGIRQALKDLRSKHGSALTGLVLDLRNNPGGLLDQALSLSDAFLDDGVIVSVRGRRERDNRAYKAEDGDISGGLPMVVLINGGSASASEIVASALKENGRALIMGRQSFGKGSVQTIAPLARSGALRLTTALYYGPNGHTIQARGVLPDIVIQEAKTPVSTKNAGRPTLAEEAVPRRREADLPDAFPAEQEWAKAARATLWETQCPTTRKEKDHMLGCAHLYLRMGSVANFLDRVGVLAAM